MVKDIWVGTNSSNPSNLTNVNGILYFSANDGTNGAQLWKSDGTATGTALVRDIYPNNAFNTLASLTNVNGTLFFRANDGTSGNELWKSDGTSAGTVLVKDIQMGSGPSEPNYLTNLNGTLCFGAYSAATGGLWKSDGTVAGTVLVKTITLDIYMSNSEGSLTNQNGTLYFSARDINDRNGIELWKSDGTTAGTVMIKDIVVGSGSSSPNNLLFITYT